MVKFKGVDCFVKTDVENVILEDMKTFMGGVDKQIQALTEMFILHLAEHNKLAYTTCNIDGVTDLKTANERIITLRDQIWGYRNTLKAEADQFIKDNNLK